MDDDLFLRRWLAVSSDAETLSLSAFIVALARFDAAAGVARESAIRRFAFTLLDVRGAGALRLNELSQFVATAVHSFRTKPGAWEGVDGTAVRIRQAMTRIEARCVGGLLRQLAFEQLCTDVPLLIAPAMLIWSTFEDLGPACERICALMVARGHADFMPAQPGAVVQQKLALAKEGSPPARPPADARRRPAPLIVDAISGGGGGLGLSSRGEPLMPANDEFPFANRRDLARAPRKAHSQPAGKYGADPSPRHWNPEPASSEVLLGPQSLHQSLRPIPHADEPSDADLASILALAHQPRPPGVSRLGHALSQRL